MEQTKKHIRKQLLITVVILIALNIAGSYLFKRFDLTQDKRYTLSQATLNLIDQIDEPLYIDVLLDGKFPGEFKRLQTETRQLLEEFKAHNSNIIFQFENPLENEDNMQEDMRMLYSRGLTPISVTVDDKGKQSQEVVFPWAMVNYGTKTSKVQLLKNVMTTSTAEKVVSSVQHLEYAFAEAISKAINEKEKKIAVIKGNGELHDLLIADFLKQAGESYFIGPVTLDSVAKDPIKTLKLLNDFDLAIIAKPTKEFTEEEKQVLDQFIINGGKTLWMIDQVQAEMDSLYNETGNTLAFNRNLNLTDMFFKYGVRVNPDLIKDELATSIKLAVGQRGSQTEYQDFLWKLSPFVYPDSENPIVKNMSGIRFEFANSIDTLKNDIKKTVLLHSSPYSKRLGIPTQISLSMVNEKTNPSDYEGQGDIPVSVLLEGKFHSVYENRVLPFKDSSFKPVGGENKMIIISDGDIIKNQLDKSYQPLELGYDKWTNSLYDNKPFLMNCVNYLLDDNGLINIRSKDVDLPLLDKEKVYEQYTTAQFITVGLPIIILLVFGLLFTFIRKRKYSR
ncbi:gliding motility-associated ABC transporter substrate-binding protein GldG [Flavobacterium alkalisoli]|uniref:Gliding motility-associated ABC transporter substrate-binding protein GldG n=1 Tax=Flavobacterium alkalisoli TaxID=2602769 RepID=A0A5B9FWX3_9FLAO|nr:gliding motility-associated ABC transporter substrate-binding protein GldG [Flavobacterium alkalisoli]QEE50789.1 gliding motility-associated ABC transporter substrate-binding protein GldG [Flavobacterium alkalisoli]